MILKILSILIIISSLIFGCSQNIISPGDELKIIKKRTEYKNTSYYVIDNSQPKKEMENEKDE